MIKKTFMNILTQLDSAIKPISIPCSKLRNGRQQENNKLALQAILNKSCDDASMCNTKKYKRLLSHLNLTANEFYKQCSENSILLKTAGFSISIDSSRQGSKDERLVLDTCNKTAKKLGIKIDNLSSVAFRPMKTGVILTNKEVKELKKNGKFSNNNNSLKSFDAKISGKVNGWIFHKLCYSNGGHQDNVGKECFEMAEWFQKYKKSEDLAVLLIDTDRQKELQQLKTSVHDPQNGLIVVNHIEFQQYLIDNYKPV